MVRHKLALVSSYLVAFFMSPLNFGAWPLLSLDLTSVHRHENATAINECPHPERDTDAYNKKPKLDWTETEQMLPSVMIQLGKVTGLSSCAKVGRIIKWKILVPLMLICGSLLSFVTPSVIYLSALSVMKLAAGVFQTYTLCGLYVMMSFREPIKTRRWNFRGLFATFFAGRAFAYYMVGLTLEMNWDRSTTYYLFGCCGLVLAIFSLITAEGITEIKNTADLTAVPWVEVLKSGPVGVACLATAGHLWVVILYVSCLPKFLRECLVLTMFQTGVVLSVIFSSIALVIISHGLLDDYQQTNNLLPNYLGKRLYASLANFIPTLFFILAIDNSCNAHTAGWLLVIGGSFLGFFYSSVTQNLQELSPHFEVSLFCSSYCFGSLFAAIVPWVVAQIASNHFHDEWRKVSWVTFLIVNSFHAFYMFGSTVKRVPWDFKQTVRQLPKN